MPTRSLNVVIAADNKGFRRAVNEVDRDTEKLDKRLKVVTNTSKAFGDETGRLTVRVGAFAGSIGTMLPTLAGMAPALTAAAAAATALAGSFAAAAAGAGALGAGLAASLAPILVVGKQVTSRFEEIKKAYEAVKTAQREGTAESKKNAEQAMQNLSKAERAMVGSLERISGLQKRVLGPASDRIIGSLAVAIDKLAPSLEKLSAPFTRLGGAIGGSIERIASVLSGPVWTGALKKFVDSATGLIKPVTTVFISVADILRDVAVAALPLVQSAVKSVADAFKDLNGEATQSRVAEIVGVLVEHTRSWWNLTKEVGELLFRVFSSGTEQGKSLVDSLAGVVGKMNEFVAQMQNGEGAGGRFVDRVTEGFAKVKAVAEVVFPILRDGGTVALGLLQVGFERLRSIIEVVVPVIVRVKDAAVAAFGWLQTNIPPIASAVAGALTAAFETIKNVVGGAIGFIRGWIEKHRDDINAFGQAWKNIGTTIATVAGAIAVVAREVFEHVLVPAMKVVLNVVKAVWPGIKMIIEGALQAIGGVINVFSGLFTLNFKRTWEGIKDIFGGALKAILGLVRGAAEGLFAAAKGLGGLLKDGVVAGVKGLAGLLKDAIIGAVKWVANNVPGLIADAVKGIGSAIGRGITGALGLGDGIGGAIGDGVGKMLPAFGGGLQGANPALAPVAGIGARFGLGVTSGKFGRENKLTSSGNISFHSSGEALDQAGTSAGMLGFFRYMKATWGPRLAELIYTPGGAGIKNGKPYTYGGKVAADHYDHVHAAIDLGTPGPGIGDGEGSSPYSLMTRGWKNGPKRPMSHNQVAALAESVGLPGETFAQIATGESGYDPDNIGHDRGGTQGLGLWQITTGFNEDIIKRFGGPRAMLDAETNARAAKAVWDRQGKGAWFGTRFVKGWNLHYKGSLKGAGGGGGSSGGSGSSKHGSSVATGNDGVPNPQPLPTTRAVQIRGTDGKMRTVQLPAGDEPLFQSPTTRGIKGMSGIKGQTQAESDALEDRMANAPTEFDYLDAALAQAEATDTTDDDRSALQAILGYRQRAYQAASAGGDPRAIAQTRRDLTSAEGAIKSLEDAIKANTDALEEQRKQYETLIAQDYRAKYNVSQSQYAILAQAISDVANGGIGQRLGLSLSGLRAPAGSVARV